MSIEIDIAPQIQSDKIIHIKGKVSDLQDPKDKHYIETIKRKGGLGSQNMRVSVGKEDMIKNDCKLIREGKAKIETIDTKTNGLEGKSTRFLITDENTKEPRSYRVGPGSIKNGSENGVLFPEKGPGLSRLTQTEATELCNIKDIEDRYSWIQAREKAIDLAKKDHTPSQIEEKLNSEDYCKKNKDAAKSIAKNAYEADQRDRKELAQETARRSAKADQRNPKELAQETARRSAEGGKTEMGIFKDVNRAHPDYVNNNLKDARKIAHDAHQAHNKNKTPSEKGKGEDKGKNTQGHNQKEEVGNKVKGNNSNSLNSSPSSSKTNDYSATQVNGKKQTSTNSEQNIPNKGGEKVQNTSKPTTSAKSSTSQKDKDTNKLTPTKKTPSKPKSPPARGPSH